MLFILLPTLGHLTFVLTYLRWAQSLPERTRRRAYRKPWPHLVSALFLVTAGVQAKVILWAKPDEGALLELSLVLETRGTNDEKTTTSSVASTRPVTRGPSRLDEPSGRGWTSK